MKGRRSVPVAKFAAVDGTNLFPPTLVKNGRPGNSGRLFLVKNRDFYLFESFCRLGASL